MLNRIGVRTIKTGIAVFFAVIVSNLLGLEYPFFVAMTAIISMDKTALNTVKMARNRICGTFIGACIGVMMAYIDRGNPILCAVGVMLMILILNQLKLSGAIGIGGIVLMAIMVHTKDGIINYAFNRTLDTIIGGCIAFAVNTLVFPYYNYDGVIKTLDNLWIETHLLFEQLSKDELLQEVDKIHENMDEIRNEIHLYKSEILFKKQKQLINQAEIEFHTLEMMMVHVDCMDILDKDKDEEIYNYHQKKAMDLYEQALNYHQ